MPTDHDREKAAFWAKYDLPPADDPRSQIIVAIAFNEGWLRGRKKLREQQLRAARRRKRTAK